jgi:hypothetical protein
VISKYLVLYCEPDASEVASSKAPSNYQIDGEISLTGHGATGQVCTGIAGDEKYILKIPPWKDGAARTMHHGFLHSEHLKVLILTYMGSMVMNISDRNMDQRCAVPSW